MPNVADALAGVRALFDPAPGTIYLDSATYGLPPRPTVAALRAALDAWQSGTADWVHDWDERGETCRQAANAEGGGAHRANPDAGQARGLGVAATRVDMMPEPCPAQQ